MQFNLLIAAMLTNKDAVDIAINGSKQFNQKVGDTKQTLALDPVLPAHQVVADWLVKCAALLRTKEPENVYANMLQKTAENVAIGMPTKAAMYHVSGGNEAVMKRLLPLADEIGDKILHDCVRSSLQRKIAEFQSSKN